MDVVRVTRHLDEPGVLAAYRQGMFPMGYSGHGMISWHRPKTRAILPLDGVHISRSLRRTLRKAAFRVTYNEAFAEVMCGCAARESTWITAEIFRVYNRLHRAGNAHSVEIWVDSQLAGGVYGVQIGGAFFAESKFHRVTDMSKVALVHLAQRLRERGFTLLEVQYWTEHLAQFGVIEISSQEYKTLLTDALERECRFP
ncbi:MAG TPA: leucyl/phenylalanyl-tRNA--protein transferase [Bryobacteraceae bacterium]|nr:leucyl/phenylalanyl-tRNA--protein transferase [Bryobacteraceae bacterium]